MLYCSDCDKDVEFKSLDVGGKLTHFCPDCGESNLFKNKEVYEAGVEFAIKTTKKFEEKKLQKWREIKGLTNKAVSFFLIIGSIALVVYFFVQLRHDKWIAERERKEKHFNENKRFILRHLKVGERFVGESRLNGEISGVVTSFTDNTPSFMNEDLPYYETPINLRGFYYKKDENSDRKSTLIFYSNLRWLYPESYNQN